MRLFVFINHDKVPLYEFILSIYLIDYISSKIQKLERGDSN